MRNAGVIAGIMTTLLAVPGVRAQVAKPSVFDAHVHLAEFTEAGNWIESQRAADSIATLLDGAGVRGGVASASTFDIVDWRLAPGLIRGIAFPCPGGRVPNGGPTCFGGAGDFPDLAQLRTHVQAGAIGALGEIYTQYYGIALDDPRMDPYYALAQEFDLPVLIHMWNWHRGEDLACCPDHRIAAGNPLAVEKVLTRYPRLRVVVQHAAAPFSRELIVLMLRYPNVHADVSGLVQMLTVPPLRPLAEQYLTELVPVHSRLLFGSDNPYMIERIIDSFNQLTIFSEQQKRDVLYNNAARFFRLETSSSQQ
jgi:hypothetical protein